MDRLYWHFLPADCRLANRDGRLVTPGSTLSVEGVPIPCSHGMHASRRILDALKYAPGPVICRVRMGGKIVEDDDKVAAQSRTVLWMYDATEVLRAFARSEALRVFSRHFSREKYPEVYLYLEGKDLSERARSAARTAAQYAAESAARYAAYAAYAARYAARSAARSAARYAARSAAYAARYAAYAAYAAESAARYAARSAAYAAEYAAEAYREEQNKRLHEAVEAGNKG